MLQSTLSAQGISCFQIPNVPFNMSAVRTTLTINTNCFLKKMQSISCRVWTEYLKANIHNIFTFVLFVRCFDVSKQILILTTIFIIATRYRLTGSGNESRWGLKFSLTSVLRSYDHPGSVKWVSVSFPTLRRLERGAEHPLPSSAWLPKGLSCNRVIGNKIYLICTYFYESCEYFILVYPCVHEFHSPA